MNLDVALVALLTGQEAATTPPWVEYAVYGGLALVFLIIIIRSLRKPAPVPMEESLPSAIWSAVGNFISSAGVLKGLVGLVSTTGAGGGACCWTTGCFTGSGAGSSFLAHEENAAARPVRSRSVVWFFITTIPVGVVVGGVLYTDKQPRPRWQ